MGPCLTLYFDLNITHHNSKKILCRKSGYCIHVRPVLGSGACSCWWSGSCRAVLFHMVPGFCRLMGWMYPRHEVVQSPAVCCKWHPGIMMILHIILCPGSRRMLPTLPPRRLVTNAIYSWQLRHWLRSGMQVSIAESSWPLDVAGCPQLETPRSGEISMEIAWYPGLGWVHIPKLPYISWSPDAIF